MKRLLLFAMLLLGLLLPAAASAHPLGNFTINHYSRLELAGDRVYVTYVLDMAEIPTFQQRQRLADDRALTEAMLGEIVPNLRLTIDGEAAPLTQLRYAIGFPPGVAGLQTTRLEVLLATGPIERRETPSSLRFTDDTFSQRIGWREITLLARDGASVGSTSAPSETISDELRVYPKDLLQSPLDVRSAEASFLPGPDRAASPALSPVSELDTRVTVRSGGEGGFASLIARDELTAGFVVLSLFLAFFWGAAHAFSPGHGKSIVAAYLVGANGRRRDAVVLGLTVTVTHTLGVFALGLVALALSAYIVPEDLYPWLNLVSALLVVAVGLSVLRLRLRGLGRRRSASAGGHDGHDGHAHDHHHDHTAHGHSHGGDDGCGCHAHPRPGMGIRGLLGIGISGGLVPCPTALVVLLAAISLHRVGYGLVLILAFSVGLAAAMTGIGLVAITAKQFFARRNFDGRILRVLPAVSAVVVLGLGIAMTVRALPSLT